MAFQRVSILAGFKSETFSEKFHLQSSVTSLIICCGHLPLNLNVLLGYFDSAEVPGKIKYVFQPVNRWLWVYSRPLGSGSPN